MKQPTIISLGEVLWDVFPDRECFGGAPANFACHAAILGCKVSMVSAVGNDQRGVDAVRILDDYSVDTSLLQIATGRDTGTVGVSLDQHGKPSYLINEDAAWDKLTWNPEIESRIPNADAVYFGTLGQRSEVSRDSIRKAVKIAAAAGVPRVLDVNIRMPFCNAQMIKESVELSSILKLSDEELPDVYTACIGSDPEATNTMLQRIIEKQNLDYVVMTRGSEGALLVTPNETYDQPGLPTVVQDTVGAGDSFAAAFVLGILQNQPLTSVLHVACKVAASVCTHAGAIPSHD